MIEQHYTPHEAAKLLRVSRFTLAQWRVKGMGPSFIKLPNHTIRYPESSISDFLTSSPLLASTSEVV